MESREEAAAAIAKCSTERTRERGREMEDWRDELPGGSGVSRTMEEKRRGKLHGDGDGAYENCYTKGRRGDERRYRAKRQKDAITTTKD